MMERLKKYKKSEVDHLQSLKLMINELNKNPFLSLDMLRKKHKVSAKIIKYLIHYKIIENIGFNSKPQYVINKNQLDFRKVVKEAKYMIL